MKRRHRGRIESVVAIVATAGFVFSVIFAVISTMEAVEERQSTAAAMDLLMAATAVTHIDQLHALGGELSTENLERSVSALNYNRESALHALDDEEVFEANRLLDEIVESGTSLLDSEEAEHVAGDHGRLQELLGFATQRSSRDAATAEQRAAFALTALSIAVSLAVAFLVWSRARAARTQALAGAQLRAGQRLQVLINDSPDILLVIDSDHRISYRSASSANLLEPSYGSLEDLVSLARPKDRAAFRAHLNHTAVSGASALFELGESNDESPWFDVRVSDLTAHALVEGHLLTIRDVTNEIHLRNELQHQANTDVLTSLPNRRVLQPSLDAARLAVETGGETLALITLDIDGFKTINDTFGHHTGDELLVQVAERLNAAKRSEEVLLRLGGDEFAVIISNLSGSATAELAANRFLDILEEPVRIGARTEHVRTSIGVATTDDPDRVPFLLSEADLALYEAKRLGGDRVVVFETALESTSDRRDQLARALREANYAEEFRIVYQPIVATESREISSLEALLRWTSPSLGDVAPDEFIPVAELAGEICSIGKWVFDEVCQQLATWADAGMDQDVSVSVNVSPRQLAEERFVPGVLATTERWGVEPGRLNIEITESAALDRTGRAQRSIGQLRAAGFRIFIDDFGTGYSNLGQLLAVAFDVIKIDRSLLLTLSAMREQAGGDPTEACAIMKSIVSIAGILDAPVVCEGVETEDQFTSLRASGVTHIQGYLTGRPAPPDQITPLICAAMTSDNDRFRAGEAQASCR